MSPSFVLVLKSVTGLSFIRTRHPVFTVLFVSIFSRISVIVQGSHLKVFNVFSNRFNAVNELKKMGADINVTNNKATINGVPTLKGAKVNVTDLRSGASLIIAGLSADGVSEISGLDIIERGYYNIDKKLLALGADIKKG